MRFSHLCALTLPLFACGGAPPSTGGDTPDVASTSAAVIAGDALAIAQAVVYPTGNPVLDVAAVRAAVRRGGTVLLKATDTSGTPRAFDFGTYPVSEINWDPSGAGYIALGTGGEIVPVTLPEFGVTVYVSLGSDTHLLGESARGAKTTIRGGTIPVRNFEPQEIPGIGSHMVYGVANLTVEGIRFTESALQSIYTTQLGSVPEVRALLEGRGLHLRIDLRHNEFLDVEPAYGGYWYSLAAVTEGPAGAVDLEDNYVNFTAGRWDASERSYEAQAGLPFSYELWEGLSVAELHGTGEIASNDVNGVDIGLLVYFAGSEHVRIADNRVHLRPEALVGISCQANHTYIVERNTVIASGLNPDGIIFSASDPTLGIHNAIIRQNHLVMDGSDYGGISFYGSATHNLIAENVVEGSAAYAFGAVADFVSNDDVGASNLFLENSIASFTPRDSSVFGSGADFFFDVNTRDNVVIGTSGVVKDLGQNNRVAGTPSRGHGAARPRRLDAPMTRDMLRHLPE